MSHEFLRAALSRMQQFFIYIVFALMLAACMETPEPTDPQNNTEGNPSFTTGSENSFITGYWPDDPETLATEEKDAATSPSRTSQNLAITNDGNTGAIYLSWANSSTSGTELKLITHARVGANYVWSDPDDAMHQAFDPSVVSPTMAMFHANRAANSGYALWETASGLNVREYMGSMHHFMGAPLALPEGHAAQFVDVGNSTVLVTQTHMMGGFGLSAYQRTAFNAYTTPAPQLHRMAMGADPAMAMAHDALVTLADGDNNVRAIWVETQGSDTRLMTAVYTPDPDPADTNTSGTWSAATTILDSAGDTHGVDLTAIHSMSASGAHGSGNIQLVLFVDTADDEAIYTMDFDSSAGTAGEGAWNMPERRDMMGNMTMLSDVTYAVYHDHHLVAWVENHMGDLSIKTLRFTPDPASSSWGVVETVAMANPGATLGNLSVALNHDGHAAAIWTETNATSIEIASSMQLPPNLWAQKERVRLLAASTMLHTPQIALYEDGTPVIAWSIMTSDAGTTTFTTQFSRRQADINFINGNTPQADQGTGGDTGGTGGDTGGTGGDTGGDTGGTGGDTGGTGGDTGTTDPNYTSTTYWGSASQLNMAHFDPTTTPEINIGFQKLQIVNNTASNVMDSVFLSWNEVTLGGEVLMVKRGTNNGSGYDWTSPLQPMGISAAATMTQFVAKDSMAGYATWDDAGALKLSEFMVMSGMPHFMYTFEFGERHAARVHINGTTAYLVAQSHMPAMNGFGLDVYERVPPADMNSAPTWEGPQQLHIMGEAANPRVMGHDDLVTLVDGNDNIRAIWKETQGTATRLRTAVFDTTAGTWGTASSILDSAATPTPAIDPAAIASFSASGEHGNANIQLVMFVDTANGQAIWTMDYHEGMGMWHDPVSRAQASGMTALSDVTYAVYHSAHLVSWVETHTMNGMIEAHVKSIRFSVDPATSTGSWGATETVATPSMGAVISQLDTALNHDGAAVAAWVESDADSVRISSAVQSAAGSAWAMKELVASLASDAMVSNVESAMHDNGIPWIVWNEEGVMNGETMFTNNLSMRTMDASMNTPIGGDTGGTGGDTGGTGGDTGGTGGDTGGTGGDTGGTGGDTGGTGGDTGGTGGDTGGTGGDTGGTGGDTGGTGGDTGGTGGTDPGTDPNVADGLWATTDTVVSNQILSTSQAEIASLKLQASNSGNLFISWSLLSDPDPDTFEYTESDLSVIRGVPDTNGVYSWGSPAVPTMGFTSGATDIKFAINPVMPTMGIGTWNTNGVTRSSEYMEMGSPHFMGVDVLEEGHATRVLYDSTGQAYLLSQTHMAGGFGLSLYNRIPATATTLASWDTPVVLHRMDSTNPVNLVNHFLIATVDGQDNIRAIWLEEQSSVYALKTATFDTGTNMWSGVTEVDATGLTLANLASGIAAGRTGTANLQVVLHQQSGMMGETNEVFALSYTEDTAAGAWTDPMSLAAPAGTSSIPMAPAFAINSMGEILVVWVERDSAMAASNTSGEMNMVMARHYMYMSGMGMWHGAEHVANAWSAADVTSLDATLGENGGATINWIETYSTGSNLVASHKIDMNSVWSQKELVSMLASTDGNISGLEVKLNANDIPMTLWVQRSTDGSNDTLQIMRRARATSIADAQPPSDTGGDTGGGTGGDTGGGDTGGGTGSAGGNDIPVNTNWTTPVMAAQMMHTTNSFRVYGPQVVMDDIGGTTIRIAMKNRDYNDGDSITTVHNQLLRSVEGSPWNNILMNGNVLEGLSSSAVVEAVSAVPTIGSLYALIRDGNTLYLARYADGGWGIEPVPDVDARMSRRNMNLVVTASGMVTLVWHESVEDSNNQFNIHAKHHHMNAADWSATETLTVFAQSVVTPHSIDGAGNIHVAWLESADANTFDLKMATFTPMANNGSGEWSAVMDGPAGIAATATVEASHSEEHKVVLVTTGDQIDIHTYTNGGTWEPYLDINGATADVEITSRRHVKIIAGGNDHFMAAWRERVNTNDGYVYRYRTALIHYMDMGGMMMLHVEDPSEVGGSTSDIEANLDFVLDGAGNAYAVWTGVDISTGTENVYVNSAVMGSGGWMTDPDLLASYDLSAGNYAGHVSIAINSDGGVGIAWDQHMTSGSMSMHHVWFVENQLP